MDGGKTRGSGFQGTWLMKKLNVTLFQKDVIDVPSLPLGESLCSHDGFGSQKAQ